MRPVEMKKSREAIADLPTQASLSLLLEPSSQGGGGGGARGPSPARSTRSCGGAGVGLGPLAQCSLLAFFLYSSASSAQQAES